MENPATLKDIFLLEKIIFFLNNKTMLERAVWGGLLLVSIFILRAIFITFVHYYQMNLSKGLNVVNSKKLYETYLKKPYLFHVKVLN